MNSLVLAYLGDAVYEVLIREYLINNNIVKVNNLQKEAIKLVSAKGQADIIKNLLDNNFFNEEEQAIYLRARNHKSHRQPKNIDVVSYKNATGFEAVIGYLYLNDKERLNELMQFILPKEV